MYYISIFFVRPLQGIAVNGFRDYAFSALSIDLFASLYFGLSETSCRNLSFSVKSKSTVIFYCLHVTSSETDYVDYDQSAPNFDTAY